MFALSAIRRLFSPAIYKALEENFDIGKLQEIRLRAGRPVTVQYGGKFRFLSRAGTTDDAGNALISEAEEVRACVMNATEHSIYAYNDDIKNGYITLQGGVRLGICGEAVTENAKIITIKNYSAVNIRIPHEILGFASGIMPDIVANNCSALILSPPGAGKTTLLRDIARQLSDGGRNVLIIDERGEIACCAGGVPSMDVGTRTDVYTGGSKRHAVECGIRAMRPDVIVTDEIFGDEDAEILKEAAGSGISVIASAHASDPRSFATRGISEKLKKYAVFAVTFFISSPQDGRRIIRCGGKDYGG